MDKMISVTRSAGKREGGSKAQELRFQRFLTILLVDLIVSFDTMGHIWMPFYLSAWGFI